jgi:hypothetical protein
MFGWGVCKENELMPIEISRKDKNEKRKKLFFCEKRIC